ncbi:MAG TPA: VWA domain-containing protein [Patescibacteria group bacterium]|nr:VWA domain-containing protein [Patescibacteria group bacterium]
MPARKRKVTRVKRSVRKKRSFFSFLSRGKLSLGVVVIMGLVLAGSLYIIGGVVPEGSKYKPLSDTPYELDFSNSTVGDPSNPDQLKLKTVPFKECANTLAVDFLVDVSGSMAYKLSIGSDTKIDKTLEAIKTFARQLPDNAAIGVQKFGDGSFVPPTGAAPVVELQKYGDIKSTFDAQVNSMKPSTTTWSSATWTRKGFDLAKTKLSESIDTNKFPGYSYAMIFISDGIPEYSLDTSSNNCKIPKSPNQQRCFSVTMDPRNPPGPDIAQEIKDKGVKIFSIALVSNETTNDDSYFVGSLTDLLKNVSSGTGYYEETYDASRIPEMIKSVSSRVCR